MTKTEEFINEPNEPRCECIKDGEEYCSTCGKKRKKFIPQEVYVAFSREDGCGSERFHHYIPLSDLIHYIKEKLGGDKG